MSISKPQKQMDCEECKTVEQAQFAKHYLDQHTDFETEIELEDGSKLITLHNNTKEGVLCPYTCKSYYLGRNKFMKHLRVQRNCIIPGFASVSSAKADKSPPVRVLEDVSNVGRTLYGYDEAVRVGCGGEKVEKESMVKALDFVAYSIYTEYEGEEISFANETTVDRIAKKFNGKKVFVSKKRPEVEIDEEVQSSRQKRLKPVSSHYHFNSTVLNGPYARILKNREYVEVNDEIAEQLNTCWVSDPQFKYLSSKLLAGAILFNEETGQALMVTTVEAYGRTATVDPHCENPDVSLPPKTTRYNRVWPTTLQTNDGVKLVIGTAISNFLVTASIRVDTKESAEAGPSTHHLKLETEQASTSTLIFIDKKMYAAAKKLADNEDCNGVDKAHSLYQLRQIRSKFGEIQTYDRVRSTADMFNVFQQQPISVFTLCNQRKAVVTDGSEDPANYILASKLFAHIAGEVFARKYKAMLNKDIVESIIIQFKNPTQIIPTIIKKISSLYGDKQNEVRILHNHDLNRHLTTLASQLASYITKANAEVIKKINNTMEHRQ